MPVERTGNKTMVEEAKAATVKVKKEAAAAEKAVVSEVVSAKAHLEELFSKLVNMENQVKNGAHTDVTTLKHSVQAHINVLKADLRKLL